MGWLNKWHVVVSERVAYSLYSQSQKKMRPCTSTDFLHAWVLDLSYGGWRSAVAWDLIVLRDCHVNNCSR